MIHFQVIGPLFVNGNRTWILTVVRVVGERFLSADLSSCQLIHHPLICPSVHFYGTPFIYKAVFWRQRYLLKHFTSLITFLWESIYWLKIHWFDIFSYPKTVLSQQHSQSAWHLWTLISSRPTLRCSVSFQLHHLKEGKSESACALPWSECTGSV